MNIAFIVHGIMGFPAGGFKIILEYANRFSECGNSVSIIMSQTCTRKKTNIAALLRYPYYKIRRMYSPKKWFNISDNIKINYCFYIRERLISDCNVIIATNVDSSYIVNRFKKDCKKYYFIQGFENWGVSEEFVLNSYKFPITKIVIAPWLQKKVEDIGESAFYVPNAFDFNYFKKDMDITERNKFNILMMYHISEVKRCSDAIAALKIVQEKYPKLHIAMFGQFDKPKDLPFEVEYYKSPGRELHNYLYNNASIYVAASSVEGWGLTVGEAMICGCAVVCTDNSGFTIMAKNGETALVSPVYDYKKLAENIITLIENDELRAFIANNANNKIKQYTWENSFNMFKSIVTQ